MKLKLFYTFAMIILTSLIGYSQIDCEFPLGLSGSAYTTSSNCTTADLNVVANPFYIVNENFADATGQYTLSESASKINAEGSDVIQITPDQTGTQGKVVFESKTTPKAFTASFRMFFKNKSGADGVSFNYGLENSITGNYENGVTSGLSIRFKNFNQDKIQLVYNNVQIGSDYNTNLEDGSWHNFKIYVTETGLVTLKRDGIAIFSTVQITGYNNANYKFAFAGRTGGASNQCLIDNFKVTDDTAKQFSINDGVTWQTSTIFNNVTLNNFVTVKMKLGDTGCSEIMSIVYPTIPSPIFSVGYASSSINDCSRSSINFNAPNSSPEIINTGTSLTGYNLLGDAYNNNIYTTTLTEDITSSKGAIIFNETPTKPKSFEANFSFTMLQKNGADGFSFNYGVLDNAIDSNENYENGLTNSGLVIRFLTLNTDKCRIYFNNVQVGSDYTISLDNSSAIRDYKIIVDADGKISLQQDGTAIFTNVQLPVGYVPNSDYRFAFAARTGGVSNFHQVSNIIVKDLSPIEYSVDGVNWQSNTNPFLNVDNGIVNIYARSGSNSCGYIIKTFETNATLGLSASVGSVGSCAVNGGTINIYNPVIPVLLNEEFFGYEPNNYSISGNAVYQNTGVINLLNNNYSSVTNFGKIILHTKTKPLTFKIRAVIGYNANEGNQPISFNYGVLDQNPTSYGNGITTGLIVKVRRDPSTNPALYKYLISLYFNNTILGSETLFDNGFSPQFTLYVSVSDAKVCSIATQPGDTGGIDPSPLLVQTLPSGYAPTTSYQFALATGVTSVGVGTSYILDKVSIKDLSAYKFTIDNGTTFTTSNTITGLPNGTYTVNAKLDNSNSCLEYLDSALVQNTSPTNNTTTETACVSYTWSVTGETYTTSGTYTYNDTANCSVETLNLTITQPVNTDYVVTACGSYFWSETEQTYTASGIYNSTIGCNSKTLDLTILSPIDSSVTADGSSLKATQTNATYQWKDCATNQPIALETNQVYSPTASGNYSVTISNGTCEVTSTCQTFTFLANDVFNFDSKITTYPNPFDNEFTVKNSFDGSVKIYDILGKQLKTQNINSGSTFFDMAIYGSGVYLIIVSDNNNHSKTFNMIKR